jgi:hypothetical protein
MDQESQSIMFLIDVPRHLSCLLNHPFTVRSSGTTCNVDTTTADFNEEQYIDSVQEQCFNRKKSHASN